ncbi:MAG TPA: chromosomal replication initiator protein DnaA [Polyangiaceae bacterium]|nr:chromosomal replication initiator protein DnaA [Polyangiaceae bacterium]
MAAAQAANELAAGEQTESGDPETAVVRVASTWALSLTARDEFVRDWVRNHFLPTLIGKLELELSKSENELGLTSKARVVVRWSVSKELHSPVCPRSADQVSPARAPSEAPPSVAPVSGARPSVAAGAESLSSDDEQRPSRPLLVSVPRQPSTPTARTMTSSGNFSGGTTVAAGFSGGNALNPKYTFSNFVVGTSNELAHAAAIASADGAGRRYNPLFLCGRTGLGKTHLMHAIAHRVLEKRPNSCVIYVSAERFTNEFIEALQHHKMEAFRARYRRQCDVLLVDDIQFLTGREQTQEEFFHTFNVMHDAGKTIVVSSDKYPQDLQRMPERLISRFNSGLVADVHVPELETRVAIVKKKAELEGIPLSDKVAVLLAQTVKSNVRELEGALIRLAAKSSLTHRSIDEEFARSELASGVSRQAEVQSVEDIQRAVCSHFRLSNADLLSKDRHKSVAFARQVAMYLCRQRLKCSFPELGRAFGNRDHTTVMSAVRRVEALRQTDPQVNAHIEAIAQKLA